MLAVDSVCKRLGGRQILDHVSFECERGAVVVLAGPNGAGKTTLLRIVAGVIEPDRGSVEIDGESIVGRRVAARRKLGYVPEAADPPGYLTVAELQDLVAALKGAPRLPPELERRLGGDDLAEQRLESLSLGERRRACLAAALVGDPAVLVLDEPSNGLDDAGVASLIQVLRERRDQGCAVLIATHDETLREAVADVRLGLAHGKLIDAG